MSWTEAKKRLDRSELGLINFPVRIARLHGMAQTRNANRTPASTGGSAKFHFCTDALPESDRVGIFREAFGRKMLRLDMEALPGRPFRTDVTVWSPPGIGIVWGDNSPLRVGRTRELVCDGNDNL